MGMYSVYCTCMEGAILSLKVQCAISDRGSGLYGYV